jgi:hypothetical protein
MTPFNPCAVADVIPTLLRRTRQGKIKGKILRLFAHKSKPRLLFLQGGYTNDHLSFSYNGCSSKKVDKRQYEYKHEK